MFLGLGYMQESISCQTSKFYDDSHIFLPRWQLNATYNEPSLLFPFHNDRIRKTIIPKQILDWLNVAAVHDSNWRKHITRHKLQQKLNENPLGLPNLTRGLLTDNLEARTSVIDQTNSCLTGNLCISLNGRAQITPYYKLVCFTTVPPQLCFFVIDNVESAVKKLHSAGDLGASALPARAAVPAARRRVATRTHRKSDR